MNHHKTLRGIGLTGPDYISTAPKTEFWTAPDDNAMDRFTELRMNDGLQFQALVCRRGPMGIVVYLDRPNLDYKSNQLVDSLESIRTAWDNAMAHGHSIPVELSNAIRASIKVLAKVNS